METETKYYQIVNEKLEPEIRQDYQTNGGIYKLHHIKIGQKQPTSILRFLDEDNKGIIYLGKTNSFISRVIDLRKTLLPTHDTNNHNAGIRYNRNLKMRQKFPLNELYVSLMQCDTPVQLEFDLLMEYNQKYGELPPLNRL